jgi:hypothetical protein
VAEVEALLKELIEGNCYPQPTCYEEADAWLQEVTAKCQTEWALPEQCILEAREEYAQKVETCTCIDEVHAAFEQKY